jgi:putative chitinase
MEITVDILKHIAPGGKETNFKLFPELVEYMNIWLPKYGIDTKGEICHFLAQTAHESNSFNTLEEYASGKAYEGRKDLGNINPGDGVKFKGKGLIETTGRFNYRGLTIAYNKINTSHLDFEEHPELLKDANLAVWSACDFWDSRNLNDIANLDDNERLPSKRLKRNVSPIEYITLIINGGQMGLDQRIKFYERAKEIIK